MPHTLMPGDPFLLVRGCVVANVTGQLLHLATL